MITADVTDTKGTSLIVNSNNLTDNKVSWFITGSVGQSKVVDTLFIPNISDVEDISIDNNGNSYTLGGGINYERFSFMLSYANLGEASAKFSGATLNRDSLEQALLDMAPKLVDGLSIETQFALWSNDSFTAAFGLGLLAWKQDYSSQLQGGTIEVDEHGVDVFYQTNLAYQLSGRMQFILKAERYQLSLNDVNNVSIGIKYNF